MINLKPNNFIQSDIAITQSKVGEVNFVSVPTSGFLYYIHPVELPLGTRIEVSANVQVTSGSGCRLSVDFLDNYTDVSAAGDGIQGFDEYLSTTNDREILKSDGTVPPGKRFFRVLIGYFRGVTTGDFNFTDLQIKTTAPIDLMFPLRNLPKTLDISGGAKEFIGKFNITTNGAATANFVDDRLELVSAANGGALLTISNSSDRWVTQEGARLVVAKCVAKVISGEPVMRLRYIDGGGLQTVNPYRIMSDDFDTHYAIFAVPSDVIRVNVDFGLESFVVAECHIKSISIECYGALSEVKNLYARVLKTAGIFALDNAQTRAASQGITAVSQTVDTVTLSLKGDREHSYVAIVQMAQFPSGEDHEAVIVSSTSTQIDIQFKDSTTNAFVNIAVLPDSSRFNFIGMANY